MSVDLPEPDGPMMALEAPALEGGGHAVESVDRGVALPVAPAEVLAVTIESMGLELFHGAPTGLSTDSTGIWSRGMRPCDAPYGSWPSPLIAPPMAAEIGIRLSEPGLGEDGSPGGSSAAPWPAGARRWCARERT